MRALLAVVEKGMVPTSVKGSNKIGYALERSNMVAFDEMCRQLAFYNCGDSGNFDVIVLTFTLVSDPPSLISTLLTHPCHCVDNLLFTTVGTVGTSMSLC